MNIVINKDNKESIYELVYDEESIKSLISEIITNCSVRKQCKSRFEARTYAEVENKINSATDWNGNKIFENVSNIKEEPVNDPFDYWRHGDPVPYSFTSDKLLSPQLVNFLINLLNGENIDYEWFTSRKELSLKQELQQEIQKIDSQINKISNFETRIKIDKLEELARRVRDYADIPEFDYDLLSKYYDIAESHITLELVQETIKYQRTLKPKTPSKQ